MEIIANFQNFIREYTSTENMKLSVKSYTMFKTVVQTIDKEKKRKDTAWYLTPLGLTCQMFIYQHLSS